MLLTDNPISVRSTLIYEHSDTDSSEPEGKKEGNVTPIHTCTHLTHICTQTYTIHASTHSHACPTDTQHMDRYIHINHSCTPSPCWAVTGHAVDYHTEQILHSPRLSDGNADCTLIT